MSLSQKPTDIQLLAHFETYLLTEKRVAQNTFAAYQRDIQQLVAFLATCKETIATSTRDDLRAFVYELNKRGITPKSVSRKISTLKLFFRFLNERFALENMADILVFPKLEQKLPVYLTPEEIEVLFRVAGNDESIKGTRNKVLIHLMYATGMRVTEAAKLKCDQLRFDTGFVQVDGKGNKERMIPLPKSTLGLIAYYLDVIRPQLIPNGQTSPYVFATYSHNKIGPLTRQSIWNILKKLITKAGIAKNISPHSLRHSLATHLLKKGANIRSLQMLLGHEQLTTVQIYTHLEVEHLRKIYDKAHPRA